MMNQELSTKESSTRAGVIKDEVIMFATLYVDMFKKEETFNKIVKGDYLKHGLIMLVCSSLIISLINSYSLHKGLSRMWGFNWGDFIFGTITGTLTTGLAWLLLTAVIYGVTFYLYKFETNIKNCLAFVGFLTGYMLLLSLAGLFLSKIAIFASTLRLLMYILPFVFIYRYITSVTTDHKTTTNMTLLIALTTFFLYNLLGISVFASGLGALTDIMNNMFK